MTGTLARQRCFSHPLREAAGRCPSCSRFFCRECVTDYDGVMLCAFCLREKLAGQVAVADRGSARQALGLVAAAVSALALSWAFFYFAGQGVAWLAGSGTR